MKIKSLRAALAGAVVVLAASFSLLAPTAAMAAPSAASAGQYVAVSRAAVQHVAKKSPAYHSGREAPQCYPLQCDYAGTSGADVCFLEEPEKITNWDDVPGNGGGQDCRNVDESFFNNTAGSVRLYYHPLNDDGGGAHACIPAGVYIPNLAGKKFNSGSGDAGYNQPVENNVGGSTFSVGACTDPI